MCVTRPMAFSLTTITTRAIAPLVLRPLTTESTAAMKK